VGKRVISGISKSYTDVPEGRFLAVIGSSGFLEISINRGRACDVINVGEELRVRD
jgi:S-adenosylmethionine hydrolase